MPKLHFLKVYNTFITPNHPEGLHICRGQDLDNNDGTQVVSAL